jgi:hypothetical protein
VITHATAGELIEGPGEALPELLARGRRAARSRARPHRHLLGEGLRAAHHAVSRLLRLLHVPADPGEPGARTLTPDEVVALVQAGDASAPRRRCSRWGSAGGALREHREFLARHGHRTTLGYLRAMCELTLKESTLLPHANPGLMGERDLAALREVNVSMGIMLETLSERLLARGHAHDNAPDKVPAGRLRTIGLAGKLGIPSPPGSSSASARHCASASTRCSPSATCTSAGATCRRSSSRTSGPSPASR